MLDLSTQTKRRNLPPDGRKRWSRVAKNRAVGYRRSKGRDGTWYVRKHLGNAVYRMEALGAADDSRPADGDEVLSFGQAFQRALHWDPFGDEEDAEEARGPLTVRQAVERYLEWYKAHCRSDWNPPPWAGMKGR